MTTVCDIYPNLFLCGLCMKTENLKIAKNGPHKNRFGCTRAVAALPTDGDVTGDEHVVGGEYVVGEPVVAEGVVGHGAAGLGAGHELQQGLQAGRAAERAAAPVAGGHARVPQTRLLRAVVVKREPHPSLKKAKNVIFITAR